MIVVTATNKGPGFREDIFRPANLACNMKTTIFNFQVYRNNSSKFLNCLRFHTINYKANM